jgi:hypothetical protein
VRAPFPAEQRTGDEQQILAATTRAGGS